MFKRIRSRLDGNSEQGFTLIELLVVIIIIGILLAIAVPSYLGFRDRAANNAAKANLRAALPSAEAYYADNGTYVGMDATDLVAIEHWGLLFDPHRRRYAFGDRVLPHGHRRVARRGASRPRPVEHHGLRRPTRPARAPRRPASASEPPKEARETAPLLFPLDVKPARAPADIDTVSATLTPPTRITALIGALVLTGGWRRSCCSSAAGCSAET